MTGPRMRIQNEQRRGFSQQRPQQGHQQRVLHAIGEISGVECVAVIHVTHRLQRPPRPRREVDPVGQSESQPLQPGPGDHNGVVGAQAERRCDQTEASNRRHAFQSGA